MMVFIVVKLYSNYDAQDISKRYFFLYQTTRKKNINHHKIQSDRFLFALLFNISNNSNGEKIIAFACEVEVFSRNIKMEFNNFAL